MNFRPLSSPQQNATGLNRPITPLLDAQIFRRFLALVWDNVVRDLGALAEVAQSSPFDGRYMDEHVLSATVRLDKPITLGRVEPLNGPARHARTPFLTGRPLEPRTAGPASGIISMLLRARPIAARGLLPGHPTAVYRC